MRRVKGLSFAFALALSIFFVDQGLKRLIEGSMRLGESALLIPNILRLTYVKNSGGAFGLLGGHGGLLLLGSAVAFAFVLWILLGGTPSYPTILGCGLILGGAAGNLLDRLGTGEVTDYLDLQFWPLQAWPVFNAADIAIVLGAATLLLASLGPGKAGQKLGERES